MYYLEVYLKYIEQTRRDVTEEDIIKKIENLDGKGAVTMSILEKKLKEGVQIGMQKGRQEGIQEGIQEGMQKKEIEIAKNLLREGAEIALVVKATGLSKSQVESLREEITKSASNITKKM